MSQQMDLAPVPQFAGADYRPGDHPRLSSQYQRIWRLMSDRHWRTLDQIAEVTGDPVTSVSAQLRHMRKLDFGLNTVEKRRVTPNGLYEYRLIPTWSGSQLVERMASR